MLVWAAMSQPATRDHIGPGRGPTDWRCPTLTPILADLVTMQWQGSPRACSALMDALDQMATVQIGSLIDVQPTGLDGQQRTCSALIRISSTDDEI